MSVRVAGICERSSAGQSANLISSRSRVQASPLALRHAENYPTQQQRYPTDTERMNVDCFADDGA